MKKLVVLGAGESGLGAAILGLKKGYSVFVSDQGIIQETYKSQLKKLNIPFEEEKHTESIIFSATEVIKSPGIANTAPIIQKLVEQKIPVIAEIEFAARYTDAKLIAITGSNGKTTTALLTYHLLKEACLNVGLAGNIGNSFSKQVAEKSHDYYVLEISSFQLENMYAFRANIAILLNITPDHLDRYNGDMQTYAAAKFRIIQNQTNEDFFIYCNDDAWIKKGIAIEPPKARMYPFTLHNTPKKGTYISNNKLAITVNNTIFTMNTNEFSLKGKHNQYNSLASGITARLCEVRNETLRQCLGDFQNVAHRLESVASIQHIEFVNDSKATNVNAVWYALESMTTPVVLIMGGIDKGNDYSMLQDLVKEKVHAIVCLGENVHKIQSAFQDLVTVIEYGSSASQAVKKAYQLANQGDTVLLSPACASFDLFKNYEDRGNQFKEAVNKL